MASLIKVDHFNVPGVSVGDLVARTCPMTGGYGQICQRYDPHTGENKVCPYWYGLRIYLSEGYAGEVRTPQDSAKWMSTDELWEQRQYQVLCLAGQKLMEPGAARPR